MHRCLIIDDEKLARQLIEGHLANVEGFEVVASCRSAIEASKILNDNPVDLLFLDVEMPVLLGIDFYKNLNPRPKVIFTTAYRKYAVDGFDLDAVDYLIKPISFSRFYKAIQKYLKLSQHHLTPIIDSKPESKNYLFVTEDRKQVKIILDTIVYIESVKNYIKIITDIKTHVVKHGITSFHDLLSGNFLRVHRSYIVNKKKVTAFTKQDIELGEIEIPIGESYREAVDHL